MTLFRTMAIAAAFSAASAFAIAAEEGPPEVTQMSPSARQVGEARYRLLAWPLFDAALWNETGVFDWDASFALTLTYRRSFSAQNLTNRTLSEMSGRGAGDAASLEPLAAPLRACFVDVAPGDRITGVSTGANSARFYFNGRQRCEIRWPGFQRSFFGIWLDASGSNRALSNQLKGRA
jgi:hypothetical protein